MLNDSSYHLEGFKENNVSKGPGQRLKMTFLSKDSVLNVLAQKKDMSNIVGKKKKKIGKGQQNRMKTPMVDRVDNMAVNI